MLWVCRDVQGQLQAACEGWLVDRAGMWQPTGNYVFLHQLEVAPGSHLHHIRRELVRQISLDQPQALGV